MTLVRPDLTVVVLCYRSGDYAPVFAERVTSALEAEGVNYEVVLVGNYQPWMKETDTTPAIVRALAEKNPRIVAVAQEKQGMMGWDMRSGLDQASGHAVAVIDGDGQMPPEDVIKIYRALQSGSADIAKTFRDTRHDGRTRVLLSKSYNLLTKVLFPKITVRDINSKPKIFRREALARLKLSSDDWFIDAEIIIKASYLGMKISEIPTIFHPNTQRPSFVSPRAVFEFMRNLAEYRGKLYLGRLN